jgi:SAM-dependent MidA family methyltransferase
MGEFMTESSGEHPSVGSAADEIRAAIVAAGGAIPFSEFQRIALYGARGFYNRPDGGRAGRRGAAFITSPEVGPLFGAVLARYLDAAWDALDRPAEFCVVDAGAGPGTLARAILAARPACLAAVRYVAVEPSAAQRALHPAGIESRAELPPGPFEGVIVANELLDNLPFRLCVFDGVWREAFVVAEEDGTFGEVLSSPLVPVPVVLPPAPAHGSRAPLQDAAVAWVADARSCLRRGRLLVIDYARATTSSLAGRPWREWLRTYRDQRRGDHYLAAPGSQDITAELAVDQFQPPDAVTTQAEFLRRWGVDELVEEGEIEWAVAAAAPNLRSVAMRSRAVEAAALLDPAGLGAFTTLEWSHP